jgi:hypothetical protein
MDLTKRDFVYPGHVQPSAGEPSAEPRMRVGQFCMSPLGIQYLYLYNEVDVEAEDHVIVEVLQTNGVRLLAAKKVSSTETFNAFAVDKTPAGYYAFFRIVRPTISGTSPEVGVVTGIKVINLSTVLNGIVQFGSSNDSPVYWSDPTSSTSNAISLRINANNFVQGLWIDDNGTFPTTTRIVGKVNILNQSDSPVKLVRTSSSTISMTYTAPSQTGVTSIGVLPDASSTVNLTGDVKFTAPNPYVITIGDHNTSLDNMTQILSGNANYPNALVIWTPKVTVNNVSGNTPLDTFRTVRATTDDENYSYNINITSASIPKATADNNLRTSKKLFNGVSLGPTDDVSEWIDYLDTELESTNVNIRDNYVNQIGSAVPMPYSISDNDYGKINLQSENDTIDITYPNVYTIDLAVKPNKYYSVSADFFNALLVVDPLKVGSKISIKSIKIDPIANDILADSTIPATSLAKGSYILLDGISYIPNCIGKITDITWSTTIPEGEVIDLKVYFTVVLLLNNIKTINQVTPNQNGDIGLASPDGSINIGNATNHIQLGVNFPTHTGSDLAISNEDTTTIKEYIDNKPTPVSGVTSIKSGSDSLTGDVWLSAGSNMSISRSNSSLIFTSTATSSVNGMTNVTITAGDNVAVTPDTTNKTLTISSTDTVTTINQHSGEVNLVSGIGITVAPSSGTNDISFTNTGIISINGIYGSTSNTGSVSITAGNNVNISTIGNQITVNATNTDTVTRVNGYTGSVTITASNGININTSSTGEVHISGESGRWYIVEGEDDTSHNWVLNFPGQLYAGEDTVLQGRSSDTTTLKILKSGATTDTVANLVKNGLLLSGDMLVIHSVFNSNTNNGTSFTAMIRSITTSTSYYTYSLVAISNSNYQ